MFERLQDYLPVEEEQEISERVLLQVTPVRHGPVGMAGWFSSIAPGALLRWHGQPHPQYWGPACPVFVVVSSASKTHSFGRWSPITGTLIHFTKI